MEDYMADVDDERYRVPGTNLQNFTAWSRENVRKGPPAFWVGWRVTVVRLAGDDYGVSLPQDATIDKVYPDCDLTPLYSVRFDNGLVVGGLSDDALAPVG
jgi:hypothetical protein